VRQFLATLSDEDVDILADVAEAHKAGRDLDTLPPDTLARYDELITDQRGNHPMTTEETVYSLEADRIEARLRDQREQLRRTPGDRILELTIEADVEKVRQLRRDHDAHVGAEQQREAADAARAQAARTKLEQRLMDEYRQAAPGTTAAEAQVALPDLLHRHRLGEQDRLADALIEAKQRIGQF
jgi:hypothetical protein